MNWIRYQVRWAGGGVAVCHVPDTAEGARVAGDWFAVIMRLLADGGPGVAPISVELFR